MLSSVLVESQEMMFGKLESVLSKFIESRVKNNTCCINHKIHEEKEEEHKVFEIPSSDYHKH